MKENKFLIILPMISMIILLLGATFSYFTTTVHSNEAAVGFTAAKIGASLEVTPLYTGKDLIPMDDTDVMKGYAHSCVDDNSYGACQAYTITLTNTGDPFEYVGTINFTVEEIEHLKYLLLDENGEIYQDKTEITSGTDLSLGQNVSLGENESKNFTLIVWVSNFDYLQDDEDGGGNFSALVTYTTANGSKVTGTFSANG